MIRLTWKVFLVPDHRPWLRCQPSYEHDLIYGVKRPISICVRNADVTGTEEYSLVTIEAATRDLCEAELMTQIYGGAFERVRVEKVEEVK